MTVSQIEPLTRPSQFIVPATDPSAPCARIPWSFRAAKLLMRFRLRGGYRLLETARAKGWLDRVVRYPLRGRLAIDVPLFREDNCRSAAEVCNYEAELMSLLGEIVPTLRGPVTLIDGGADIGLFTTRVVAAHPNIASACALEPNAEAYPWLSRNLSMLPIAARPICAAAGESEGRGELRNPAHDPSDHAKFVSPSQQGMIRVVRIDDIHAVPPDTSLLLKLDVEGAELAALRGAERTIQSARQAVVVIEAHPRVAERTGIDPVQCLRLLASIRPFEFRVAERPDIRLSPDRPLFDQLSNQRVYNIVAISREAQAGKQ